ncbi:MAG: hypothetical protein H6Q70_2413 [Firmicutes bacterium]|nr:hypothetical protein [Bacillota bacterium]
MQELISAIKNLISNIEQATITLKPDPKLMMEWGDLAEIAINAIEHEENDEIDQLLDYTQKLLDTRQNYMQKFNLQRDLPSKRAKCY